MTRALALLLVFGCSTPETVVVVRLATDVRLTDLRNIVIEVREAGSSGGGVLDFTLQTPDLDALVAAPPGEFVEIRRIGVRPTDDYTRRFEVSARVVGTEGRSFRTRVISSYVRERIVRLDLYLASDCFELAEECEEDETCGLEGCVDPFVPPESLPELAPDDPFPPIDPRMRDGGTTDRRDAGPPRDASTPRDAGADASNSALVPVSPRFPYQGHRSLGDEFPTIVVGTEAARYQVDTVVDAACTGGVCDWSRATRSEVAGAPGAGDAFLVTIPEEPVEGRVWWRIRGCRGTCPSAEDDDWSSPRYVERRRPRCDSDGDGASELVAVDAFDVAFVVRWVDAALDLTLLTGSATATTCADVDADGRSELAFASTDVDLYSGPTALGPLLSPGVPIDDLAAGDFDGDGFEDVAALLPTALTIAFGGPEVPTRVETRSHDVVVGGAVRRLATSDVDGDGRLDLFVSATGEYGAAARGTVERFSVSAPRTIDRAEVSVVDGESYGFDLAGLDDVDGDGFGDLVVGAPSAAGGIGRAYVLHGPDLSRRDVLERPVPVDLNFGVAVGQLPQGQVAVGHMFYTDGAQHLGAVHEFAGTTSVRSHFGDLTEGHLGAAISSTLDVDGDGIEDWAATIGGCVGVRLFFGPDATRSGRTAREPVCNPADSLRVDLP